MSVCDQPILSTLCEVADETTAMVAAAPIQWIADAVGQTAAWFIEGLWVVFDSTTMVDVESTEFIGVYNLIFGIGVMIALLLTCFQLITAVVKREPGGLARAGIGLGKSILGSFVAVSLVALGLEIVDQLCLGIVQATGNSMQSMGDKITLLATALTTLNAASPGIGAIVTLFLGGLTIAATAIMWFSLLVRKSLLLLTVALAPLALAGFSWDTTRGWAGKWLMFVIALIVSKLVLTVILLVAVAQISVPIALDIQALTDPLAGIVLLAIAAFAPYMTYKAISWLGTDYYHAMSAESEAKQALNRPVPVPNRLPGNPSRILGEGGGSRSSGGSGGTGKPPAPTPTSSTGAGAGAGAGSGASASAGGGAGAGAGSAGAGAAGGPIGVGVALGAAAAKKAATLGPELGSHVAGQADSQMEGAQQQRSQPSPPARHGQLPPPRALPPAPTSGDSQPPKP